MSSLFFLQDISIRVAKDFLSLRTNSELTNCVAADSFLLQNCLVKLSLKTFCLLEEHVKTNVWLVILHLYSKFESTKSSPF